MNKKRVAINGFGRIGRAFVRIASRYTDTIEIVAINDLMDTETAAYLLTHDTVHGSFEKKVDYSMSDITIAGSSILWLQKKEPQLLPWKDLGIDVVIEATGLFTEYEKAHAHITAGAKKVIISAPVKNEFEHVSLTSGTSLMGIPSAHAHAQIISNASCTTNAVAIPMKLLDDALGIEKAVLSTTHAYTATQLIVDGATKKKDLREGRSGAQNIVPSSTGAATALTKVMPNLKDKFDGISLRVPVSAGSIADITFISKRPTSVEEVNAILTKGASFLPLFSVTNENLVSSDIIGLEYVSIADLALTRVVDENLVKIMCWYDNEMGYTRSLVEQVLAA
ncbi:MAG: glyceraldehyde 3-phosphate dehydrogenase NAD-binding domain-containing protein [Alphaproteobacteria bacterium]|nr:glyceraldehyde 3-phosphate dehydrogenase NAD-binding domain-containing protein [Alphaproteobacteria bacterium]